jgi:hypothetical protein
VLEIVVLPRQHLAEQSLEEALPDAAAHLGRAQDLLEPGDVLADVEDPLGDLPELAQAPLHRAHRLVHVLQLPRHAGADLAHLHGHVGGEVLQLLPHGSDRLGLGQACLGPCRLDLALKEQHGLIGLAPARLELLQANGHPPERHRREDRHRGDQDDDDRARVDHAAPGMACRPRQWRQTGRRLHGAHTSASRRFRHWPDMRL